MAAVTRIVKHELRIMVFVLFMILASLFIIRPVYAASSASSASPSALPISSPIPYTLYPIPSYVSPTSPLYTDLLVNNLFHSFSCLAIGQSMIGQPCLTYQMTQNAQGMLQGIPVLSQVNTSGGALGAVTGVIGALYQNPPVRTADYLASLGEGMGLVKTANAQVVGSGAAVLNPILKLWQVSRNISYVIMIIIFLVIGLMVMFRNKLNPQTVITAQAALPGLVIGLILITFSYFFAGLISDMAFVGTNVVGYYFSAVREQTDKPQNLVEDMRKQNILSIFSPFTGMIDKDNAAAALSSIWGSLSDGAQGVLTLAATFFAVQTATQATAGLNAIPIAGPIITGVANVVTGVAAWKNPTAITGILLGFVASAVLLIAMLKLLFRLINAYLTIIFLTITAPFQLLAAALPGRQGIATGWILNMLANVLAFPAVLAVLYFVAFLLDPSFVNNTLNKNCALNQNDTSKPPCVFRISQSNQQNNNGFTPTAYAAGEIKIIDSAAFPLFGGMNLDFLRLILAFGALVALPVIPDIIARTVGRMSQAGQMIGQELSTNIGQGRGYAGRVPGGISQAGEMTATGIGGRWQQAWHPIEHKFTWTQTGPGLINVWPSRNSDTSTEGTKK